MEVIKASLCATNKGNKPINLNKFFANIHKAIHVYQ